ncbi:uncharacterized protein LOC129589778 isoform X2 [Paramacrobiotus metropolitanus]|uniref:uncharacterized protein LOC129589778 isoform X2 n=1 Tax=Paramacrobiotus metropolitanus TaxID=2943436 RepID=UPI002445899F|nr:uncharacterized protein LOC129589778 isoform X2 [Paramacrobiotus metropolitanus]
MTKYAQRKQQYEGRSLRRQSKPVGDARLNEANGIFGKIFYAQTNGYSGIIIHPSLSKAYGEKSVIDNSIGNRTTYPAAIPSDIFAPIKIDVHFVSYEDGMNLKKFVYDARPSATTQYRMVSVNRTQYYNLIQLVFLSGFGSDNESPEVPEGLFPVLTSLGLKLNTTSGNSTASLSQASSSAGLIVCGIVIGSLVLCCCCPCMLCTGNLRPSSATETTPTQQTSAEEAAPAQQVTAPQTAGDAEVARNLAHQEPVDQTVIAASFSQVRSDESAIIAAGAPLTAQELQQLCQIHTTEPTDNVCPICQQLYSVGELIVVLPCLHAGHNACLVPWLATYSRNCPLCRTSAAAGDSVLT